ncbi:CpcT/CpeT family chromophore lyase [Spongiivirga sp. MCCC 1A20706]|uniref:CpcT/CpeT family chromophore lyase n=1 Tax=Spongiivirga sp. MCCC 1A20706 TaxID=3160963 RepID=UPI0039779AB1
MKNVYIFLLLTIGLVSNVQCQSNTNDLETMKKEVAMLLNGDFDNEDEVLEDLRTNAPKEKTHMRINRSFIKIDAPHIADYAIVSATNYKEEIWKFDTKEFLVWVLRDGEEKGTIKMIPLNFKKPEDFMAYSKEADKLKEISKESLFEEATEKQFQFIWHKDDTGNGYTAISKPFRMLNKKSNKMVSWTWKMQLNQDYLLMETKGVADDGEVFDKPPFGMVYNLKRLN